MNAQSIIREIENMPRDERMINLRLAEIFDRDTPISLYLDYYELSNGHPPTEMHAKDYYPGNPGTTPDQWEHFLEIPEIYRYRQGKIAKLTEYAATKALKNLNRNSDNVSALKELIKTSKALQGGNAQQTIIMSYVTPKRYEVKT